MWQAPSRWSIRWQIAILLVLTQLAGHIVTGVTIDLSTARSGGGENNLILSLSDPMFTALRITSPGDAQTMSSRFATLAAADSRFRLLDQSPLLPDPDGAGRDEKLAAALRAALPPVWQDRVTIFAQTANVPAPPAFNTFAVAARLWDGQWLVFQPSGDTLVENVPRIVALLGLLFIALPLMFLSVWSGAALVAPIAELATGAERFANDIDAPALREAGPIEIRKATHAFNRMRAKIRKLVADRALTLASIGHDMRTPLTRVRLRLELLLEPGQIAGAIDEDLRSLERMIDDGLEFLRAESRPIRRGQVDLAVLARTIADDYADTGFAMTYHGPTRLAFSCDHDLVRRILDNIAGNAAKFATAATLSLTPRTNGAVIIELADNGPGIPVDQRDRVIEPFSRVEAVRAGTSQGGQGFGLGLAIARDLTERHGGTLTLLDNVPSGLLVRISLPPRKNAAEEVHRG